MLQRTEFRSDEPGGGARPTAVLGRLLFSADCRSRQRRSEDFSAVGGADFWQNRRKAKSFSGSKFFSGRITLQLAWSECITAFGPLQRLIHYSCITALGPIQRSALFSWYWTRTSRTSMTSRAQDLKDQNFYFIKNISLLIENFFLFERKCEILIRSFTKCLFIS